MKRRNFVQTLLVTPALPAAVAAQQASAPQTAPQQTPPQPVPQPNTPARQVPQQPPKQREIPRLALTEVDATAETEQRYFTASQFSVLEKLGSVLMPPLKGNPGADEAKAPEFLDFLISVSPADRQSLYKNGLDKVAAESQQKFGKHFSDLDAHQVDAILRPLLVARPWPEDLPEDRMQNFIAQVHQDLRTATINSREWAETAAKSGHRFTRGFRGTGQYWAPVDPISEG